MEKFMEHFINSRNKLNTAVVLAGGKSSRLSFDKQAFNIKGNLMSVFIADCLSVEFERVIIVSNKPKLYRKNCPYEVISDTWIGLGPKAGILTGLEHAADEFVYFTAVICLLSICLLSSI